MFLTKPLPSLPDEGWAPASPPVPGGLPVHARTGPGFEALLGVSAGQVIPSMDLAGDDIPYQVPEFTIALPAIGLDRRHVPVRIANPFGGGTPCQVSCDVAVRTEVPARRRGIHTSRIGDAIAEACRAVYPGLQDFASALAGAIRGAEYGGPTEVRVSGIVSYLEAVPGWKREKDKTSLEHVEIHARSRLEDGAEHITAGLTVNHITACPCVQQTYKHALERSRGDSDEAIRAVAPLLTHSQRCRTRVEIEGLTGPLPVAELLEVLDATLYRVQNTLPREYELALVYRAHARPQFIEDAVRQTLAGVGRAFGARFPASTVRVHSVSYESIHDYDIVADVDLPMAALTTVEAVPA